MDDDSDGVVVVVDDESSQEEDNNVVDRRDDPVEWEEPEFDSDGDELVPETVHEIRKIMQQEIVYVDTLDPIMGWDLTKVPAGQKELSRPRASRKKGSVRPRPGAAAAEETERASIFLNQRGFDPKLYLSSVHGETCYEDLEHGLEMLKGEAANQTEQLKSLVQDNFDRFVGCKDTIDDIHRQLRENELSATGAGTIRLENTYLEILKVSERVFRPMLDRKDEMDRVHNSLDVLKRFRFLLQLPAEIKESMANSDWEKVVHAYKKAKAMMVHSKLGMLHTVLQSVLHLVAQCRERLLSRLATPTIPLEMQERHIGYLSELDCTDEDPAWFYVSKMAAHLQQSLQQCCQQYSNRFEALRVHQESKPASVKISDTVRMAKKGKERIAIPPSERQRLAAEIDSLAYQTEGGWHAHDNTVRRMTKQLSALVSKGIPDLWRFCQHLLAGKYAHSAAAPSHRGTAAEKQVGQHLTAIFRAYAAPIQDQFRKCEGEDKPNSPFRGFLHPTVVAIRDLCSLLKSLDIPPAFLTGMDTLLEACTTTLVNILFGRLQKEFAQLHGTEDWVEVDTRGNEGSVVQPSIWEPCLTTSLPTRALSLMESSVQRPILLLGGGPLCESVRELCLTCLVQVLRTFADCLHCLAFAPTYVREDRRDERQRLLLLLGNCHYTKAVLIPSVFLQFAPVFETLDVATEPLEQIKLVEEVEGLIIDRIVRFFTVSISPMVQAGILRSGIDWASNPPKPVDVQTYVKDVLLAFSLLHSEIGHTCRSCTADIMDVCVERFSDVLLDTVEQLDKPQVQRVFQLELDVEFLEHAFSGFRSEGSSRLALARAALLRFYEALDAKAKDGEKVPSSDTEELSLRARVAIKKDVMLQTQFQLKMLVSSLVYF